MRFLADMGVDLRVVEWLRQQGHDAVHLLHNTRAAHVIERLSRALEGSAEALEKGGVVVVEEGRYRVRELPVGRGGGAP